jgi:uncharacterized membrane protein YkoI
MRTLFLALTAASALTLVAPASAQDVGLRPYPNIDLAGFSGDPTALPKAVANIEKLTGGRVVEIRYNNVAGVPSYDVVLAQGSDVRFLRFSKPGAGPIELTQTTTPSWMLDWRARTNVALEQSAKVPLADAITKAEASMNGAPAVAAGIAQSAANPSSDVHAYNVSILREGDQHRVAVDSQTGYLIENPASLAAW